MDNTCCFIGHRKVNLCSEQVDALTAYTEELIVSRSVDTFLFGSKSEFNDICYDVVTRLKEKYPHIKRIYIRAEFPDIDEDYRAYLLERYEDTYYPERIRNSGRACYVERNCELIDRSGYLVTCFDGRTKGGGTAAAYGYALKKGLVIKNVLQIQWTVTSCEV